MSKSRKSLNLDDDIFARFEEICEENNVTPIQAVTALMHSLIEGEVMVASKKIISMNAVSRETHPSPPPQKPDTPKRLPGRPKISQERKEWHDQDHSNRPLEKFDYPDERSIHGDVDPRGILDLDEWGEVTRQTCKQHMFDEYEAWRVQFKDDDRMRHIEFWNFARWVAKKFFTLNKITDLRYDEMKMQPQLFTVKDDLEDDYQFRIRGQAWYDKHKTMEGFDASAI